MATPTRSASASDGSFGAALCSFVATAIPAVIKLASGTSAAAAGAGMGIGISTPANIPHVPRAALLSASTGGGAPPAATSPSASPPGSPPQHPQPAFAVEHPFLHELLQAAAAAER